MSSKIRLSKSINNNEISEFYRGVEAFNQKDYPKAHHIWEHSWMRLGKSGDRAYIKPFIMLTASYQNYKKGKISGGDYLFKCALERLRENQDSLAKFTDVNSLIDQIQIIITKYDKLDRFNNIQIIGEKIK